MGPQSNPEMYVGGSAVHLLLNYLFNIWIFHNSSVNCWKSAYQWISWIWSSQKSISEVGTPWHNSKWSSIEMLDSDHPFGLSVSDWPFSLPLPPSLPYSLFMLARSRNDTASEHAIGASGVMSTDPILSAVDLWNMEAEWGGAFWKVSLRSHRAHSLTICVDDWSKISKDYHQVQKWKVGYLMTSCRGLHAHPENCEVSHKLVTGNIPRITMSKLRKRQTRLSEVERG